MCSVRSVFLVINLFSVFCSLFHCCVLFDNFFLRVRATLHFHNSDHSCPQKNGSRIGSKVRQTTWEWTHLTISRKSLIGFLSNRAVYQKSACCLTNHHVSQEDNVKQFAFFLTTCFSTIKKRVESLPSLALTPKTAPFRWEIKSEI